MKTSRRLNDFLTFAAAATVGCAASIALASVAAVSHAAPSLRPAPEVVRLDPVVVTISKTAYDAIRKETAVASADAKTVAHG